MSVFCLAASLRPGYDVEATQVVMLEDLADDRELLLLSGTSFAEL